MRIFRHRQDHDSAEAVDSFPISAASPPLMISALLPALFMALFTVACLLVADYAPPSTGQMAVVFPALTDEVTAWKVVVAAGGSIVAPSRFSNVVVAYAPDSEFASRVRSAGALFTLAARGLCEPLTQQTQPVSR